MTSDIKNPYYENPHPDYESDYPPTYNNNQQSPDSDHLNHFVSQNQERQRSLQKPNNNNQYPCSPYYPSYEDSHYPFAKHQREISNNFRPPQRDDSFQLKSDIKIPFHESQNRLQSPNDNSSQDPQKSRRDSSEATGYLVNPSQKSQTRQNNDPGSDQNDGSPRNSRREYFQVNSPHEQETPTSQSHRNQPNIEVNPSPYLEDEEYQNRQNLFEGIAHFQPETGSHNRNESSGISLPNFIHHLRVQSQDLSGQPNPLSLQSPALDLNDILNFGQAQGFQEIESEHNNILNSDNNDIQTFNARNKPATTTTEAALKSAPPHTVENPKQSPREPAKLETKNRLFKICLTLTFIYIILGLALTITLMVYHFDKNKTDFTPISGALQYISFNLDAAPIMELQLADKGSTCPTGLSSLSIGTWSGTVWGCSCPSALKREVCRYSESKSCSLVFPYAERSLYDWRGSIWCGRRAEIGTELVEKKTCPTGYMQCSPGICVVNTGSCPITSLSVSSKTSSNLFGDSSGKYLTVQSTLGEDPLIDITISPNSVPCFSDGYYNTGDTETYILLRDRETGCLKYGLDSEYSIELDQKTQYNVFSVDNSFSTTLFSLLVGYKDITQNTNAVLSSRKRIGVTNSDSCLTFDSEKFQTPISSYNNLRKALTVTSIIAITILGTFILLLLGLGIHLRRSMRKLSFLEALNQKRTKGTLFFASIFAVLGVAIYTVMFILVAINRSGMMETYEDYKTLKEDCFTGKPALVLQDYQDFVDTVIKRIYRLSLALLIISWTIIAPALILLYKHICLGNIS